VTPQVTPSFDAIPAVCSGATITLPATSKEGIAGTWSPHQQHGYHHLYLYATGNTCATTATLTVTVTPQVTPSLMRYLRYVAVRPLHCLPHLRKHCRHLESRHQQHGYHHLYLYANRKYLCHHGHADRDGDTTGNPKL
jgi:hypothetical protein